METLLEVQGLTKYFFDGAGKKSGAGHAVLEGVSFTLREGECLGIVGRSGCGKSTMARIVTRLMPADEGKILLRGRDITRTEGRELAGVYETMQMIFQLPEDSFDPRKTLGWSIGEAMRNRGWERERIFARTDSLLREVGLPTSYRDRYPHEVSGGECQRAAISRALALSPKILICDEATSALDVTSQAQIIRLLRRLIEETGLACLFITHDLALLPQLAHRVIVMQEGRIVESGTTREILEEAKAPETRALLSADFFRRYGEEA